MGKNNIATVILSGTFPECCITVVVLNGRRGLSLHKLMDGCATNRELSRRRHFNESGR